RAMGIVVPASRRALVANGHRPEHLDRYRKAGRSVAVFRGVHVDATHAAGLLQRVRAALATQAADAVAGMQTSAWLHRLRWLPQSWSPLEADIDLVVSPSDCHRQR